MGIGEHRRRSGLKVREKAFLKHYLAGEPGLRGVAQASALAAGFSERDTSAGAKVLHKPAVQAAIAQYAVKHDITINRVLAELSKIAFSDMRDYATWGPDGITLTPSAELLDHAAVVVAEVSEHETTGEHSSSRTLRFKLHDKLEALQALGKNLRLFDAEPVTSATVFNIAIITPGPEGGGRDARPAAQANGVAIRLRDPGGNGV